MKMIWAPQAEKSTKKILVKLIFGWVSKERRCHTPNMFGTVDIGIMSPVFQKLKSFFKNIFISLEHLELRKRKIADIIPHTGYYEFKKDSNANDITVQQYYHKMYNIHIK